MNDWFEVTASELAFLIDLDPGQHLVLDELGIAGDWLRNPSIRSAGRAALQQRVAEAPELPDEYWELVGQCSRIFATTNIGSVLVLKSGGEPALSLLTAVQGAWAAQLAIRGGAVGIRPTRWPMTGANLAEELLNSIVADEVLCFRVYPNGARTALRWSGGVLTTEDKTTTNCGWTEALESACQRAIGLAEALPPQARPMAQDERTST